MQCLALNTSIIRMMFVVGSGNGRSLSNERAGDVPPVDQTAEARLTSLCRGQGQYGPTAWLLSWSAAEPDLVSIGIAVRDLAHAVRIGFPLGWIESPIGDLRDECIEIIDEERVHRVTGVFRLPNNVHVPMLRHLPNRLCVGWKKCGRGAQQLFVPWQRRHVIGNRDSSEQVEPFGLNHAYCLSLKQTGNCRVNWYLEDARISAQHA